MRDQKLEPLRGRNESGRDHPGVLFRACPNQHSLVAERVYRFGNLFQVRESRRTLAFRRAEIPLITLRRQIPENVHGNFPSNCVERTALKGRA